MRCIRFWAGFLAGSQAGSTDVRSCPWRIAICLGAGPLLRSGCCGTDAGGSGGSEMHHSLGWSQASNGARLCIWASSPDVVGLRPPEGRGSSSSPGVSSLLHLLRHFLVELCGFVCAGRCACIFGWLAACFLGARHAAILRETLLWGCSRSFWVCPGVLSVSGLPSLLDGFRARLLQQMWVDSLMMFSSVLRNAGGCRVEALLVLWAAAVPSVLLESQCSVWAMLEVWCLFVGSVWLVSVSVTFRWCWAT